MTSRQLLSDLHDTALKTWVLHWFELFADETGGFHERLDASGKSLNLPKRLVTQCRQVMVYAQAGDTAYSGKLHDGFDFIRRNYFIPATGGSVFSLTDPHYDLYALGFVLSACAAYYGATKNTLALEYAAQTIQFINQSFLLP